MTPSEVSPEWSEETEDTDAVDDVDDVNTGEATAESALDRPVKAAGAFLTISEVGDQLGIAPHILRHWETKFTQIKPMKRGGGRRYYRPEDVAIIRRIRDLLQLEGYTIKGVQKILRSKTPDAKIPDSKTGEISDNDDDTTDVTGTEPAARSRKVASRPLADKNSDKISAKTTALPPSAPPAYIEEIVRELHSLRALLSPFKRT